MALATPETKRQIIESLLKEGKYRKPFEKGEMPLVSFFGGSWNDYAQVVFTMMLLDTMLEIQEQLTLLNGNLASSDRVPTTATTPPG